MTTNPHAQAWGAEIKARREAAGESRADLAEALDVSRQAVAYWEAGRFTPSPAVQAALVARYGIEPDVLARIVTAVAA